MCSHVCKYVYVNAVEARRQPWVPFLRCFSPCFLRRGLSLRPHTDEWDLGCMHIRPGLMRKLKAIARPPHPSHSVKPSLLPLGRKY